MNGQFFTEFHDKGTGIIFRIKREIFSEKSEFQEIKIFETETFGRMLTLDGLVMLTERDEFVYHEMLVHPAFSFKDKVEKVGIIGGGDGGTVREVLRYPEVVAVQLIEIDRKVVEASLKYLEFTSFALKDKRVEFYFEDGVKFLKEHREDFDIIIVDSSDPVGPAISLYSMDFYESIKNNLKESGIVVFQSESIWHHLDIIKKQVENLRKIFKNVKLYLASIPTYPGGCWSFTIAADIEFTIKRDYIPIGLRYFNKDIQRNLFTVPEFVKNETG